MLQREHSAILSTFIKLTFVFKIFVLSIFEWPFYTGLTVFGFLAFLLPADCFQYELFQKILSGIPSECQSVWIQIKSDFLSGLRYAK